MAEKKFEDETSIFLKGTCMEMCPERERILRERQRRLHPFEVLRDSSDQRKSVKPEADIRCTVKEFSRPAAGREIQAHELRPASVLVRTMDFLLGDVLAKSSPWSVKCDFVSDRIRAIRQDLTAQGIASHEAIGIEILEKATRYYLVMAVKLCCEPLENFDPVLHNTHIQECLKKLLCLYELEGCPKPKTYSNQPSFQACYLLFNLGDVQAYNHACHLPEGIKKSKIMQLAFGITKAHLHGNFVSIFRMFMQLPFLESCAFHHHIQPIRYHALDVMNTAYSSKNLSYPLSSLAKTFCFDTEDAAVKFCSACGVGATAKKVFFFKGQFLQPDKNTKKQSSCDRIIMSKLQGDITDMLLFHQECDLWENKVAEASMQLLDSKENSLPTCASTAKTTAMVGVQQREVVSRQRCFKSCSRGRGRARKNMNPNTS